LCDRPPPAEIVGLVRALVGCVACGVRVSEADWMARDAGLTDIYIRAISAGVRP
jgi:hypothetical protein